MKTNANENLNDYLGDGIKRLIGNILKATFKTPRTTRFMLGMLKTISEAREKREKYEAQGFHVPVFLICSITRNCNLFCQGCYARSNGICGSGNQNGEPLPASEWKRIFDEAVETGISFNILAGGEPLLRKDVIACAARTKKMIFPIFTNGTLLENEYIDMIAANPNLIPIISMEGFREETDGRRGEGLYNRLEKIMKRLKARHILYGVSVTVTTANMSVVLSDAFSKELHERGCSLVFFIEYVPVEKGTESLAPGDRHKAELEKSLERLKKDYPDMIYMSFPGDEPKMGGCLAAGRGFFHINYNGDAEPCPFSPYSDRNLTRHSFMEVLDSPFFGKLTQTGLVGGEHAGGCVLFEHEETVKELLENPIG